MQFTSISKNVDTIEFFDEEANDSASVIVRRCRDKIAICITFRSDGDIEAFLDRNSAARLLHAIEKALRDED